MDPSWKVRLGLSLAIKSKQNLVTQIKLTLSLTQLSLTLFCISFVSNPFHLVSTIQLLHVHNLYWTTLPTTQIYFTSFASQLNFISFPPKKKIKLSFLSRLKKPRGAFPGSPGIVSRGYFFTWGIFFWE